MQTCETIKLNFKPGDRWSQVNSIRVGASLASCGRHPEYFDPRPYGVALGSNYPLLEWLLQGGWGEQEQAECFKLLSDALFRGSYAMSVVAMMILEKHTESRKLHVLSHLTSKQQNTLNFHLEMAKGDPDLERLFINSDN